MGGRRRGGGGGDSHEPRASTHKELSVFKSCRAVWFVRVIIQDPVVMASEVSPKDIGRCAEQEHIPRSPLQQPSFGENHYRVVFEEHATALVSWGKRRLMKTKRFTTATTQIYKDPFMVVLDSLRQVFNHQIQPVNAAHHARDPIFGFQVPAHLGGGGGGMAARAMESSVHLIVMR